MKIDRDDLDLTYKLAADVKNPKGDARTKFRWQEAKIWKAGLKFRFAWVETPLFASLMADKGITAMMEELWIFELGATATNGVRVASRVSEDKTGTKFLIPGPLKSDKYFSDMAPLLDALIPMGTRTFDTVRERYAEKGMDFDRAVLKFLVQEGHVQLDTVEDAYRLAKSYELYDLIGEPNE